MEAAADSAALRFLDKSEISSRGLAEFLDILGLQAGRRIGLDPYLLTHPEPELRAAAVRDHLIFSRYTEKPLPLEFEIMHARMRAKLDAFLLPFNTAIRIYPESNRSIGARYARAIAFFRRGELAKSLTLIDELLADLPNDAFVHELRGDALFRNGKGSQAIISYREAVRLASNEPLLRVSLARALLESNNEGVLREARDNLLAAVSREPQSASAWRELRIAYGKLGERGNQALAEAEFSFLTGDLNLAKDRANKALDLLPQGSPGWRRAQDLLSRA